MNIFRNPTHPKMIIGLIHLIPLPGTPRFEEGNTEKALNKALADVRALVNGGAHGCLVQTIDGVYTNIDDTDYARVAAFSLIVHEVRKTAPPEFIVGAQMMWNNITPSLGVCKAADASFTRATALVGRTQSQWGEIVAEPEKVQAYREHIAAQDVAILAEVQGYHFHGEGQPLSIAERAAAVLAAGADAVEIMAKDEALNHQLVLEIKSVYPNLSVILGGGTDAENVQRRLSLADGALVGSAFEGGNWGGPILEACVSDYMARVRQMAAQ